MIEIELKSDLLLDISNYDRLNEFLFRRQINPDETVIAYVESTSLFDYLVKLESCSSNWTWSTSFHTSDIGYLRFLTSLSELRNHLRVYSDISPS